MRVRKLLVVFAAFALLVAACGDDDGGTTEAAGFETLEEGILTVGSDISWPPFESYDESGEVVVHTQMGQQAVLVGEIPLRAPVPTLMVQFGDWIGPLALAFLAVRGMLDLNLVSAFWAAKP